MRGGKRVEKENEREIEEKEKRKKKNICVREGGGE